MLKLNIVLAAYEKAYTPRLKDYSECLERELD